MRQRGAGALLFTSRFGGLLSVREYLKHLDGRYGNTCAGTEDSCDARFVKEVIVLSGDYTAGSHEDVLAAEFLEAPRLPAG